MINLFKSMRNFFNIFGQEKSEYLICIFFFGSLKRLFSEIFFLFFACTEFIIFPCEIQGGILKR